MRRLAIAAFLLLLLLAPGFSKIYINKSAPASADAGAKTLITLSIEADSPASVLDIVEELPLPLELSEWSVSGYDPAAVLLETRQAGESIKYHWTFSKGLSTGERAFLTYLVIAPGEGTYDLTTTYLYPSSFDRITRTVRFSESRPLVVVFVACILALLVVLYLRHRSKRGERKLFSAIGKLLGKKKHFQ